MSEWYKASDKETIGSYKAIKHSASGELALIGRYGQIWQVNDTTCAALITSARIANKFLPESKRPLLPGDESQIRFPISELDLWTERLQITANRSAMIRRASSLSNNEADND